MGIFLGLDIGTTGVKALAMRADGKTVCECTRAYALSSPQTNWFEQNPLDWWTQSCAAVREIMATSGVRPSEVDGIGLSGQYHGLVALDGHGEVVRPAILWNDQRTARQAAEVVERVGRDQLLTISGTRGALYFTACKLLWVRENEPEAYRRIAKFLLPKDYVRLRLTGSYATDVTDASGTILLDLNRRAWSPEVCRALQIDTHFLPDVYESSDVTGTLSAEAAREMGLAAGIPVAGGGGDQACAAIGNGIVEEGLLTCSVGTSGVIYASTDSIKVDPNGRIDSFCHAVPGKWALLGVINSAAASLEWFKNAFCKGEKEEAQRKGTSVYAIIDEEASKIPAGSDRLVFLPYLAGERHPHGDPLARGAFLGLHSGHTLGHAARAVMEGVAFSFRDCLEVLKDLGVPSREIRVTGGGTKSSLWMSILAGVTGQTLFLPPQDERGAAMGAAMLAAAATKAYPSVQEACRALVSFSRRIEPDAKQSTVYDGYFRLYRALYPLLKETYGELASL